MPRNIAILLFVGLWLGACTHPESEKTAESVSGQIPDTTEVVADRLSAIAPKPEDLITESVEVLSPSKKKRVLDQALPSEGLSAEQVNQVGSFSDKYRNNEANGSFVQSIDGRELEEDKTLSVKPTFDFSEPLDPKLSGAELTVKRNLQN